MGNFNKRDNRSGNFGGGRGNDRGGDRRGGFGSSGGAMHQATCDECGKTCEVPFKPTQGKPIYCNDCFRSKRASEPRRPESGGGRRDFSGPRPVIDSSQTQRQFEMINQKLDRVLEFLTPKAKETEKIVMPLKEKEGKGSPEKKEASSKKGTVKAKLKTKAKKKK